MSDINWAQLASGVTVASDNDFPPASGRRVAEPNPFIDVVRAAFEDGKRRDLPGRFSVMPYAGRKNACEAYTVVARLHQAAREVGCTVQVRRVNATSTDTELTFKATKGEKAEKHASAKASK
ncbi:hypothetical protein [Actinomycetospora atypica]|uniref:Uncharacterized protein n=1 Tax=Actinomycetospora atypica TaxID=1290095 RepID=A0ABV9YU82_9PSEU